MVLCFITFWLQAALLQTQATAPQKQGTTLSQEHARKGYEFSQRGDMKAAEAEFRLAIELAPNDAAALAMLGVVLAKEQNFSQADVYFEQALKISPEDLGTRYNLALNQFLQGQLSAAQRNLDRILKAQPGHKLATLLLGTVLEKLKDYRRATSLLESIPELVRQQPESIAVLARCYYHTDRREKAREALDWLSAHSRGAEAVFLGGKTAAQCGDFEMAERLLTSIRSSYRNPAALGYEIALVQYDARHFSESQSTLLELIDAGSRDPRIFNLLSWCDHRLGRPHDAVAAMKQAIQLDPASENNYDHLAQILLEEQRYSEAYEDIEKALEVAPNSSHAYKLKGNVETQLGIFNDAVKSYRRAVELNPADADSLLGLALVEQKLFNFRGAAADFDKGIARFPGNALFYQAYGRMMLESGIEGDATTEDRAVSLLKKAINLDHSLADAHYQLGKFLLAKEHASEALPHLEVAVKLSPDNGEMHLALANAYRRLDRNKDSANELRVFKSLRAQDERKSNSR
jgi:tetratricopeptide (TPR) repeat protein